MLILFIPIVLGFLAGYFLTTGILIGISALCVIIGIFLKVKAKEMAELLTLIFVGSTLLGNAVMWITHYQVTHQTWFGGFLS